MLDCLHPIKIKPLDWPWQIDGQPMTLEQSGALIQITLYRWGSQCEVSEDDARKILSITKARAKKIRLGTLLSIAAELCRQRAPIGHTERARVGRRNFFLCHYCGTDIFHATHVDHATPVARGGFSTSGNYRPSCGPCNLEKGTMTEAEYIAFRRGRHVQA